VDLLQDSVLSSQLAKEGKLKLLAALTEERVDEWPDVPTIGEALPGYEIPPFWLFLGAPAGTPDDIKKTLAHEIRDINKEPETLALAKRLSQQVIVDDPGVDLRALLKADSNLYAKILESLKK
jgi:tripartite-type tricarboxylate transporter receptor subunit TctC